MDRLTRRSVLRSGAVATAGVTGFAGMAGAKGNGKKKGKGKKGGAAFTFTEPTVDTFSIVGESSSDETFQPGCGKGGELQPYSFFYAVTGLDGDGETDRLYPHPGDKRFGEDGDEFKINNVCETETGRDRAAYWLTIAPA